MTKLKGGLAEFQNVNMNLNAFAGTRSMKENQIFFHELAHAIDNLGLQDIEGARFISSGKTKAVKGIGDVDLKMVNYSGMKQFDLKKKIKTDLERYVLGDTPTRSEFKKALGKKPDDLISAKEYVDKLYAHDELIWEKEANFKAEIQAMGKENPYVLPDLSDIIEATGQFGSAPFGSGHAKGYWKGIGNAESEFFAEVTDSIVTNKESYELIKKIFPNAVDAYWEIVDEILKAGE